MGKRNYAIILLSARNGLRGSDIINLKLTDIDWRGGEIRLIQKKAGIERYAHDGKGFHALRRTLGKELTLAEIPIMTTAQILGHQSLDSSKQYIPWTAAI